MYDVVGTEILWSAESSHPANFLPVFLSLPPPVATFPFLPIVIGDTGATFATTMFGS